MRFVKATLGAAAVVGAGVLGLTLTDRLLASGDPQAPSAARATDQPVPVETVLPQMARFTDSVRAVGTARARKAATLLPDASGRIRRIAFVAGQQVEQGDLLVALDDRAEQADLASAEATLAEANANLDRQERLNRSGSTSDAAFQTARAEQLRALAERDRAQVLLEDRELRAPFAGVMGLTDLVEGQLLDAATPVATLDDLDVIEIDFAVPETLLPRVAVGQGVQLRSSAWPDRVFQAQITSIDTRVDATSRSIALRAQMPNDDRALTGGMFLQAELILDERQRLAVPESALSVQGDVERVLVVRDGAAEWAQVDIGQQDGDIVEVLSGLDADTPIIMSNLHRVVPGGAVDAVARPAERIAQRRDAGAPPIDATPAAATLPPPATGVDG